MSTNLSRLKQALKTNFQPDEARKIFLYLQNETVFFTAPASTKYHGAVEGGLLDHSLRVYEIALKYAAVINELGECKPLVSRDVVIASLFHDLGKGAKGYYKKNVGGAFDYGPLSKIPHAHLSGKMLVELLGVSDEVYEAVLCHNGMFTGTGAEVLKYWNQSMLMWIIHQADMTAAMIEKENEEKAKADRIEKTDIGI